MMAIKVATDADVESATAFDGAADWLLFDAKAPPQMANALPGGNAISFDWSLLADRRWNRPWMLSGGLNAENLAEAVRITGARGRCGIRCRDRPGVKVGKIVAFLELCVACTIKYGVPR
jgi:phosphoribosylanthranilate isomerase